MPDLIDTDINFFADTPLGKDPDAYSPTLRSYHRRLWSKPLPNGKMFDLTEKSPGVYLHHKSDLGEFSLSSDAIGHTFRHMKAAANVVDQIPAAEMDAFFSKCCTIGGYIVFPSNKIQRKMTINGARGLSYKIRDRFDLTLECIRRHYKGQNSPMRETLDRYSDFFDLFDSFSGYVEFFLLEDLVRTDGVVDFFLPFDDFRSSPLPESVEAYSSYKARMINFVNCRSQRMQKSLPQ